MAPPAVGIYLIDLKRVDLPATGTELCYRVTYFPRVPEIPYLTAVFLFLLLQFQSGDVLVYTAVTLCRSRTFLPNQVDTLFILNCQCLIMHRGLPIRNVFRVLVL